MNKIAIFISGEGSNATRMLGEFQNSRSLNVQLVYSSKANRSIEELCNKLGVSFVYLPWHELSKTELLARCQQNEIQWIILAGFLKLIPDTFIKRYPKKIINIHPSLLPNFGGKGMFGMHVHEAVIKAKETVSGITIHYVDGVYDEGQIINQFPVSISPNDTALQLFEKIRVLEVNYFVKTIAEVILAKEV